MIDFHFPHLPQCSWVTITSRKKVEQNQAYPVIALYMDINWAKFQNPTHSLFWENAIWICVVKSLHGELRFTIFGHFAIFHPLNQARAEFDINRTWSLWKNLSFATKKLKIGRLSLSQSVPEDGQPRPEIGMFTK